MNTRNLLILMALGGVAALFACSSEDADKFGSSDSFCTSKAETECQLVGTPKCGVAAETCKQARISACKTAAATAAGAGGSYVSSAAQDCIDKIDEIYKGTINPDTEAEAAKVCDRVFRGSKAVNTQCGSTVECEGSLICDAVIKVCAEEQPTSLKSACGNPGQVCEKGSYCQPQGAAKFCVEKKKLNDICGVDNPCDDTLRCVNHCQPRSTGGQACDTDNDCAPEAPFCDTTKKCRPKYESTSAACKTYGAL